MIKKRGQGKRVIRQLNSLLWGSAITKKTKISIYKTVVESLCTYEAEAWETSKRVDGS